MRQPPCVAAVRVRGRPPHHPVAGSTNALACSPGANRERRLAERLRRRVRRGCASPLPAREPGPQGRQACDCAPPPSAAPRAPAPAPALAPGNYGLLISRALIRRRMLVPRRERRRPPGAAGSPAEPEPDAARCVQSARRSSSHGRLAIVNDRATRTTSLRSSRARVSVATQARTTTASSPHTAEPAEPGLARLPKGCSPAAELGCGTQPSERRR